MKSTLWFVVLVLVTVLLAGCYAATKSSSYYGIEQDPLMGKNDLPPYRHVRAAKHVVFYRLTGDKVQVSRILHSAMDFLER